MTQLILDQLRDYVLTQGLVEDDRLPPERELAARLGVSRPSLRNALDWLDERGALRRVQGGGTFLQANFMNVLAEHHEAAWADQGRLAEVVEARLHLEPLLVRLVAERAAREDLEALATEVALAKHRLEDLDYWRWHDLQFHLRLSRLAGNAVLGTALEAVLSDVFLLWTTRPEHFDSAAAQAGHEQILEALLRRDADGAAAKAFEHLQACGHAAGNVPLRVSA